MSAKDNYFWVKVNGNVASALDSQKLVKSIRDQDGTVEDIAWFVPDRKVYRIQTVEAGLLDEVGIAEIARYAAEGELFSIPSDMTCVSGGLVKEVRKEHRVGNARVVVTGGSDNSVLLDVERDSVATFRVDGELDGSVRIMILPKANSAVESSSDRSVNGHDGVPVDLDPSFQKTSPLVDGASDDAGVGTSDSTEGDHNGEGETA